MKVDGTGEEVAHCIVLIEVQQLRRLADIKPPINQPERQFATDRVRHKSSKHRNGKTKTTCRRRTATASANLSKERSKPRISAIKSIHDADISRNFKPAISNQLTESEITPPIIKVGTMREIPDITCCGSSPQKLDLEACGFLTAAAAPDAPCTTVALRFNGHNNYPVEYYCCSEAIISLRFL